MNEMQGMQVIIDPRKFGSKVQCLSWISLQGDRIRQDPARTIHIDRTNRYFTSEFKKKKKINVDWKVQIPVN